MWAKKYTSYTTKYGTLKLYVIWRNGVLVLVCLFGKLVIWGTSSFYYYYYLCYYSYSCFSPFSHLPPAPYSPLSQSIPYLCLCPWVVHKCSWVNPFTIFYPVSPFSPPAAVRLFHVSMLLFLLCSLICCVH